LLRNAYHFTLSSERLTIILESTYAGYIIEVRHCPHTEHIFNGLLVCRCSGGEDGIDVLNGHLYVGGAVLWHVLADRSEIAPEIGDSLNDPTTAIASPEGVNRIHSPTDQRATVTSSHENPWGSVRVQLITTSEGQLNIPGKIIKVGNSYEDSDQVAITRDELTLVQSQ
jgi:hypothetical protein